MDHYGLMGFTHLCTLLIILNEIHFQICSQSMVSNERITDALTQNVTL